MNDVLNCVGCGYMKKYDYGKKMYYCDHLDRIDDMGKLGGELQLFPADRQCALRADYPCRSRQRSHRLRDLQMAD